jgi:hypothetical protein
MISYGILRTNKYKTDWELKFIRLLVTGFN